MIPFELTILGTGSALPTSKRYHTAQVLNVRERFFLIDCGEGAQIQMRKYSVKFSRINHIFISHLHGDHYFGLIGLLTTYTLLGRTNDLHIYAHSELPKILKSQLEYMGDDIQYQIIWHPLNFKKEQTIFEDEAVKITSFPLKHRMACCGFLFTENELEQNIRKEKIDEYDIPVKMIYRIKKGENYTLPDGKIILNKELTLPAFQPRKYAFCTDTAYLPDLHKITAGVDLLYHEATFDKSLENKAEGTYHSTARQAALVARDSNAQRLIIGHFSSRYKEVDFLVDEAREYFNNTEAAYEGMIIQIPQKRVTIE
ncbi:MAG: ribonuclease Z [Prolixibacteraceae bacterium]|nr:ribonuclease Z [Prolixibacteraceae bacterium]MBN2649174.1 ribonuclease Z [Prolixibacteraceae bacterium]